eukprot:1195424-Prorocentrum_minimum.AAC.5
MPITDLHVQCRLTPSCTIEGFNGVSTLRRSKCAQAVARTQQKTVAPKRTLYTSNAIMLSPASWSTTKLSQSPSNRKCQRRRVITRASLNPYGGGADDIRSVSKRCVGSRFESQNDKQLSRRRRLDGTSRTLSSDGDDRYP